MNEFESLPRDNNNEHFAELRSIAESFKNTADQHEVDSVFTTIILEDLIERVKELKSNYFNSN